MNSISKVILISLLLSCFGKANAQGDTILRSLPKYLNGFDDVILTYELQVGDWQVIYDMVGYGIKGNKVFKIKMTVLSYSGGCVDGVIKKMEQIRKKNNSLVDSVKAINFTAIQKVKSNPLNCQGSNTGVRDGSYYFLITKHKKNYTFTKSYEPDFSKTHEIQECAIFIETRNRLIRILGNQQ